MALPSHLRQFAAPIPVLDKGSITLLDVMGDDHAVLQAARTSTGAGLGTHVFEDTDSGSRRCRLCGVLWTEHLDRDGEPRDLHDPRYCGPADRKLLRYLLRNRHATPFEACQIKIHVRLPIFVERQWARHRAAGFNEISARYTQLPSDYYVPAAGRLARQSSTNRQGSGQPFSATKAAEIRQSMTLDASKVYASYQHYLDEDLTREVARVNLPLSMYTEKVWWTSLRMLLHFLGLRKNPHAQWEIQQYAEVLWTIVEAWCPWTAEAFVDYILDAHTFSRQEMELLRALLVEADVSGPQYDEGLRAVWRGRFAEHSVETQRERKAFLVALGLL